MTLTLIFASGKALKILIESSSRQLSISNIRFKFTPLSVAVSCKISLALSRLPLTFSSSNSASAFTTAKDGKLVIAFCRDCPVFAKKNLNEIQAFLESGLDKKLIEYAAKIPAYVRDYRENYQVIKLIGDD